jgi:hypothetical protein
MTLSGPDALRSIEEALRDIRREENEIVRRLGRSSELVTKIRAQKGELVHQLMATRLEQTGRSGLVAEIAEASTRALQGLARHDAELDAMGARIAEMDAGIAKASADRATLQLDAAERDAQLRALADKARPRLGKNADYVAQLNSARELAQAAELSLKRTLEAEADRASKGRAYRADPLFMYLWEKAYGAKTNRANGLVAWLDAWIAGRIGYARARSNFVLINELPLRLREHAAQLQGRAEGAALEVAKLERAAVDSAGGQVARERLGAIVMQIVGLDRTIAEIEDRRDEAMRAQRDLAEGGSAAYAQSFKALSDLLTRADVQKLVAEARATPKGQDPTILAQLDDLDRRSDEEEDEALEQRSRLRTLAARRRDLEDLLYEIKAQGFDNPHSRFAGDELVGDALNVFLRGEISLGGYWDRWRMSQAWDLAGAYGGPGGGWGRAPSPSRSGIGRSRPAARGETLISAA